MQKRFDNHIQWLLQPGLVGQDQNRAGDYTGALSNFNEIIDKCNAYDAKEAGFSGKTEALNGLGRYNDALVAANAGLQINKSSIESDHLGITSLYWLIDLIIVLVGLILSGWRKRQAKPIAVISFPAWLIPVWFHIYFTVWFFISGFYHENKWMTFFALSNLFVAVIIHGGLNAVQEALKKS